MKLDVVWCEIQYLNDFKFNLDVRFPRTVLEVGCFQLNFQVFENPFL